MIQKARFIRIQDQLRLCLVTYVGGNIVDINGPVQCVSDPGADVAQFIHSMDAMLTEAAHGSPVLGLSDLPESIKEEIENVINEEVDLPAETVKDLEEAINEEVTQ